MADKAKKIQLAPFAKASKDQDPEGLPAADNKADTALSKEQAQALKFSSSSFWTPNLPTQHEVSETSLINPNDGPGNDDKNHHHNTNDTALSSASTSPSLRPASRRKHSPNKSKRRYSNNRPFLTFEDEYPPTSDTEIDNDPNMPHPRKDSISSPYDEFDALARHANNTINRGAAARRKRQQQPGTPASYPRTSESDVNVDGAVAQSLQYAHLNAQLVDRTSNGPNRNDAFSYGPQGQRPSHAEPPKQQNPANGQPEGQGLSEQGANYMMRQAQDHLKAHARQQSQPPSSYVARKPSPGATYMRSSSAGSAEIAPLNPKPYGMLGAPRSQALARAADQVQFSREYSAPASIGDSYEPRHPQDEELDYDLHALHSKRFSELLGESFDHDPRRSNNADTSSVSLSSQLPRLAEASEEAAIGNFMAALSYAEWNEAGDWLQAQDAALKAKIAQKRQEQRDIASGFEEKIAERNKQIESWNQQADDQKTKMQKGGSQILRIASGGLA